MKKTIFLILFTGFLLSGYAQVPQAFSYKLQIKGNSGNPHANKKINLKISIIQGTVDGNAVYIEKHQVNTSPSGLVDIEIGRGTPIQGLFTEIDWKNWPYFVKAELDLKCSGNYNILAVNELLTVPYAMLAGNVTDNNDADADPENELQVLSISNDSVFLSRGGFIVLPVSNKGNYFYGDHDGDSYGDKYEPLWLPEAILPPFGFVTDMNDCNDNDAAINPLASEILGDGIDQDCDGTDSSGAYTDDDGDGFTENQGDCNDNNAAIYPGTYDSNDGIDNNCNGAIDEGSIGPMFLDWRNYLGQNFMSPVKSTGTCDVGYAFAPVAALETMIRYRTNSPEANVDLSEQHVISCTSGNDGCSGGNIRNILEFMRDSGIVEESNFPYASGNGSIPSCEIFPTETKKYKISGYQKLSDTTNIISEIKSALMTKGPVIAYIKVYEELYTYESGIYDPQYSQFVGWMANLIVGYGSSGIDEYWIVRNNWGESWGENGYYKVAISSPLSLIHKDWVYVINGFY